jgi:NADH-quinone oxidoreductase subunit E
MKEGLIEEIVHRYDNDEGMLIPILQDIQAEYGYLPPEKLRILAKTLDIPLMRIYSVSTFYASFRHAPKGQHDITLCMGTVCYLKGSGKILEAICEEYNIQAGETTKDRLFTLQGVNCVGACALAPVMVVDGKYHDHMTPDSALKLIKSLPREENKKTVKSKTEKKSPKKSTAK